MEELSRQSRRGGVIGNQRGFTLIEIIIVIVLLGILSATVAPKFLDLRTEARKAAVDGLAGGLKSGAAITYAACLVATGCDETAAAANATVGGTTIAVAYGWPTAASIDTAAGTTLGNFTIGNATSPRTYVLKAGCTVTYTESSAAGVDAIIAVDKTTCN